MSDALDALDRQLLALFDEHPHIGVLGASRSLGVARGTVQARLDKLQQRGVIASFAPQLDPAGLGHPVTAFCTLEISQHLGAEAVIEHLRAIPQVLEAHTITGDGDLMLQVVAADNADLQRVIDRVVALPQVERSSTVIALSTPVQRRVLPLALLP